MSLFEFREEEPQDGFPIGAICKTFMLDFETKNRCAYLTVEVISEASREMSQVVHAKSKTVSEYSFTTYGHVCKILSVDHIPLMYSQHTEALKSLEGYELFVQLGILVPC